MHYHAVKGYHRMYPVEEEEKTIYVVHHAAWWFAQLCDAEPQHSSSAIRVVLM